MKLKTVFAILAVGSMLSFAACNHQPAKSDDKAATADTTKAAIGKYTCPMHPEIVQDSMGTCSKCGMDLEKVTAKKQDSTKK